MDVHVKETYDAIFVYMCTSYQQVSADSWREKGGGAHQVSIMSQLKVFVHVPLLTVMTFESALFIIEKCSSCGKKVVVYEQ